MGTCSSSMSLGFIPASKSMGSKKKIVCRLDGYDKTTNEK